MKIRNFRAIFCSVQLRKCSYISNTYYDNINEVLKSPITSKSCSFLFNPQKMKKALLNINQLEINTKDSQDQYTYFKMWNLPVDNEEGKKEKVINI